VCAAENWHGVLVRCHSEYAYAQEPVLVIWDDGEQEPIVRILRRWRTPDGPAFLAQTAHCLLELRYREHSDEWLARQTSWPCRNG
jgi:hypothetical protein